MPFTPGTLWPDTSGTHINAHGGGLLYHGGRYYWYGEHKVAGRLGNSAQVGVHVYSSANLLDWDDEGIALAVSDDPSSEIVRGSVIERPKVIFCAATGRFVMWFHLELMGHGYRAARSGVAVSSSPVGPFEYLGSCRPDAGVWPLNAEPEQCRPLSAEEQAFVDSVHTPGGPVPDYRGDLIFRRDFAGGQMARDMTLFVDDDGAAYHVFASEENGTLHISRLSDDYLSHAGQWVRALPGEFNEAPAIFRHDGRYWMFSSGCTGWKPNPGRLAVADSIMGPWTALGNPCVGTPEQLADTFESQSTYVIPVVGREGAFIFAADRWRPDDAIDGRYVWLPVIFRDGQPELHWHDSWDLSVFDA